MCKWIVVVLRGQRITTKCKHLPSLLSRAGSSHAFSPVVLHAPPDTAPAALDVDPKPRRCGPELAGLGRSSLRAGAAAHGGTLRHPSTGVLRSWLSLTGGLLLVLCVSGCCC